MRQNIEIEGEFMATLTNNSDTECSAMRNRGVNEAFTEAARVALQVKPAKSKASSGAKCTVM